MRAILIPVVLLGLLTLSGCKKDAEVVSGPQATVTVKDGTSFTGVVTASSPTDMTLQGPTGESRTYPLDQVLSVKYADTLTPPVTAPMAAAPKMAAQPRANTAKPASVTRPARPVEEFRTIPAGTTIQVRNNEPISSQTASAGQTFSAVVNEDVLDTSGNLAIPKGSDATLVVLGATDQGKIQGRSELIIDLGAVNVAGHQYRLDTADMMRRGTEGVGTNKRTGVFTGGGAALGGIIGAIAGGGKGAAIGAASGAGAGAGAQGLTRGKAVRIAAETLMTFRLEAPVRIREIQ